MSPFENFLKTLAESLEFESLSADDKGACLLLFEKQKLSLLFEYDDKVVRNSVLVTCKLFEVPDNIFNEVLMETLEESKMRIEVFSLKPETQTLFLHRRFHPSIEMMALKNGLENFLELAVSSKEKIEGLIQNPQKVYAKISLGEKYKA